MAVECQNLSKLGPLRAKQWLTRSLSQEWSLQYKTLRAYTISCLRWITSKLSERPLKFADQKTERGKVLNPEYIIDRDQPTSRASPLRINVLLSAAFCEGEKRRLKLRTPLIGCQTEVTAIFLNNQVVDVVARVNCPLAVDLFGAGSPDSLPVYPSIRDIDPMCLLLEVEVRLA